MSSVSRHALRVQSVWRGRRTRIWMRKCAERLPSDVWQIVLSHMRAEWEENRQRVRRACMLRLLRLQYGPIWLTMHRPLAARHALSSLRRVRDRHALLDSPVRRKAVALCLKLLERPMLPMQAMVVNSVVERLV